MATARESQGYQDRDSIMSPGEGLVPVVKSDSTIIAPTRALWVGTAGTLVVDGYDEGVAVPLVNAQGWMHIRVTKVYAATTAADIVAVY